MGSSHWTPERIVQRLRAWNNRYGQPPKTSDWKHTGADADGSYPSEATVKRVFKTWNKAISEAKLETRPQGRPHSTPLTNATANVSWTGTPNVSIPANGLYGSCTPHYYSYPVYTDTGAQKKLDALKAVLEQDPETPASVLLAIIDA